MSDLWKPALALVLASLASAAGTIGIRLASDQNNLALAIFGSSLWALSATGFVYASSKGLDLSVLAASMSAAGLLVVTVTGILAFGDAAHPRIFIALGLIIVAIALLALPTPRS